MNPLQQHVGMYLREARAQQRLSFGDLARRCGAVTPRQVSKTAQRLVLLERESVRDFVLIKQVIVALDLEVDLVKALLQREHDEAVAEWNRWADEPVRPELALKAGPIWVTRSLPETITSEEQAIDYTLQFLKEQHPFFRFAALNFNRRISHHFKDCEHHERRESTPESSQTPYMSVGRTKFVFNQV